MAPSRRASGCTVSGHALMCPVLSGNTGGFGTELTVADHRGMRLPRFMLAISGA